MSGPEQIQEPTAGAPSDEYVFDVCKAGQGAECCRYLTFGSGWLCAKHTGLAALLDQRVFLDQLTAQGDNCPGYFEALS